MEIPLRLRPASRAAVEGARLVRGGVASAWLEEIARWRVPMRELELLVLPRSAANRAPAGVLVVLPQGANPEPSCRSISYRLRARTLWLPAGAELSPRMTDAEIIRHAAGKRLVLLPPNRLAGFEASDVKRVTDLIARPPGRLESFGLARQGPRFAPRLRSLSAPARDDAGTATTGVPADDESAESQPAPSAATGSLGRGVARALRSVSRVLGGEGKARAAPPAEETTKSASASRRRELSRLVKMLESNPDQGLRYAVPLGRGGPPSPEEDTSPSNVARLVEREVEFRFASGGARAPSERWDIPPELFQRLLSEYLRAANRELELGRYRRAAFVFSELLGDDDAAANALRRGEHFREAAVMLRDRLGRTLEAAECFERAGLLLEAIELYEAEGEFERVGDLYRRVGNTGAAERAYRGAVERRTGCGEYVAAARVLEIKLRDVDAACELLAEAWWRGGGASDCLGEAFAILARHDRHPETRALMRSVRREAPSTSQRALSAILAVGAQARESRDADTRALAADIARVLTGGLLKTADSAMTKRLMQALAGLAPRDRVLTRDARRFAARARRKATPRRAGRTARAVRLRTLELPAGVDWCELASTGEILYAAGTRIGSGRSAVIAHRQTWDGHHTDIVELGRGEGIPRGPGGLVMAIDPRGREPTILALAGAPRAGALRRARWPEVVFPSGPQRIGTPTWLPDRALGAVYSPNGRVLVVHESRARELQLSVFSGEGHLRERHDMRAPAARSTQVSRVTVTRSRIWIAGPFGLGFVSNDEAHALEMIEAPDDLGEAISLQVVGDPSTSRAVVAAFERGVLLADEHAAAVRIGADLEGPRVAVVASDRVVVVSGSLARIYALSRGMVARRIGELALLDLEPIAALATDGPRELAVATRAGAVEVFGL